MTTYRRRITAEAWRIDDGSMPDWLQPYNWRLETTGDLITITKPGAASWARAGDWIVREAGRSPEVLCHRDFLNCYEVAE